VQPVAPTYAPIQDVRIRLATYKRLALYQELARYRDELDADMGPLDQANEVAQVGADLYTELLPEAVQDSSLNAAEREDLDQIVQVVLATARPPQPPAQPVRKDSQDRPKPPPQATGTDSVAMPPVAFTAPAGNGAAASGSNPFWILPPPRGGLRLNAEERARVAGELLAAYRQMAADPDRDRQRLLRDLVERGNNHYRREILRGRQEPALESAEELDVKLMVDEIVSNPGGAVRSLRYEVATDGEKMAPLGNPPQILPVRLVPSRLADHVALISSVSGGSLATAYYLHQRYPHTRHFRDNARDSGEIRKEPIIPDEKSWRREAWGSTYKGELFLRMRELAGKMRTAADSGLSPAAAAGSQEFRLAVESAEAECQQLVKGNEEALNIAPWLPTSAFVDDMATDFMAPLLRGVIDPGMERGRSVVRFWEDRFEWTALDDNDLHSRLVPPAFRIPGEDKRVRLVWGNAAPLALFNACDVERGSRVILGAPPLPPGLISDPGAARPENRPYSLTDRGDDHYHVRLAEAVRLSANFPWAFEVAELPLRAGTDTAMIVDGGIVDNSGIDSVVHLLRGVSRHAQDYEKLVADGKFGQATALQRRCYKVMNDLRRRGVLLLEIDSGAKQIGRDRTGLFASLAWAAPILFRPIQALNNTSYTNAALTSSDYDVVLQAILKPEAPIPKTDQPAGISNLPPLVRHVRITCNHSENVITAWTLGPQDKAQVLVQFLVEWMYERPVLQGTLDQITDTAKQYRKLVEAPGPEERHEAITELTRIAREYEQLQTGLNISDLARKQFYSVMTFQGAPAVPPFWPGPQSVGEEDSFRSFQEAVSRFRTQGLEQYELRKRRLDSFGREIPDGGAVKPDNRLLPPRREDAAGTIPDTKAQN
jgi:hypothetical protein